MIARTAVISVLVGFLALTVGSRPHEVSLSAPADTQPLHCLIVGGGPDRRDNPVALENNIAYVRSLLPTDSSLRILYADADLKARNVRVEADLSSGAPWVSYQSSKLDHVDGPSTLAAFDHNLSEIGSDPNAPLLLYFTGHGAPDPTGTFANNAYMLWGGDGLQVSDLSKALADVPRSTPLTLVMVQCFSGAFASVFFDGSQGDHPELRPASCGFFASVPDREAAGCTPDINQADYRDFTTYFFGALTGHDRVGRTVPSADYDHDGVVEMDEAYAYTLAHDQSIDTPMATSDAYVLRFTDTPDKLVFHTSYKDVAKWASPAQLAALSALSDELGLTGDDRLARAFDACNKRMNNESLDDTEEQDEEDARWIRFVRLCRTVVLEHQIMTQGPADVRAGLREILAAEHRDPLVPGLANGSDPRFMHRRASAVLPDAPSHPDAYSKDCGCTE